MLQGLSNWLINNLNWIVPILITAIFSILNIRLATVNQKLSENQLKLQNDSFCFELLEHRMEIYLSVRKILSFVLQNGTVSYDNISAFMNTHQRAYFLFDHEIDKKLESIGLVLLELRAFTKKVEDGIQRCDNSSEHLEVCEKEGELLKQLSQISTDLKNDFEPYIGFKNYRIQSKVDVKRLKR